MEDQAVAGEMFIAVVISVVLRAFVGVFGSTALLVELKKDSMGWVFFIRFFFALE